MLNYCRVRHDQSKQETLTRMCICACIQTVHSTCKCHWSWSQTTCVIEAYREENVSWIKGGIKCNHQNWCIHFSKISRSRNISKMILYLTQNILQSKEGFIRINVKNIAQIWSLYVYQAKSSLGWGDFFQNADHF